MYMVERDKENLKVELSKIYQEDVNDTMKVIITN